MLVYQTDAAGVFIGTNHADESPLEPGIYHFPAGCVPAAPPALDAGERARWSGTEWLIEPIPVEPEPEEPEPGPIDLVAYAADMRWQKEIGGIIVAGVPIATDDRSKLMITGARVAAMADPNWSTIWHGADGNTYPIDAAAMVMISDEVQAHVNATFQTFAAVKAAIDAEAITTTAEIDAAFA